MSVGLSYTHSVLLYLLTASTKRLPPALDLSAATEVWPLVLSVILGLISVSACSFIASGSASPLGQQWSQYPKITPKPLRLPLLGWTCVWSRGAVLLRAVDCVLSSSLVLRLPRAQILTSNQRHSDPSHRPRASRQVGHGRHTKA